MQENHSYLGARQYTQSTADMAVGQRFRKHDFDGISLAPAEKRPGFPLHCMAMEENLDCGASRIGISAA